MINQLTPHTKFAHDGVSELFLADPDRFLRLLDGHGNGFLQRLWEKTAGTQGVPTASAGATPGSRGSVEFTRAASHGHRIVLVQLPHSDVTSDPAFVALTHRGGADPKAYILEGTRLGVTRVSERDRLGTRRIGAGPEPVATHVLSYLEDRLAPETSEQDEVASAPPLPPLEAPKRSKTLRGTRPTMDQDDESPYSYSQRATSTPRASLDLRSFSPTKGLSALLITLLGVAGVLYLIQAGLGGVMLKFLSDLADGSATEGQADGIEATALLLTFALIGTFSVTTIVFTLWIYRAHRNLRALGATELRMSSHKAWIGCLIPLLNFVHIPRVASEIWNASEPEHDGKSWRDSRQATAVSAWWGLFLVAFVLERVAALQGTDSVDELTLATELSMISNAIRLSSTAFLVYVVFKIGRLQRQRLSRVAS